MRDNSRHTPDTHGNGFCGCRYPAFFYFISDRCRVVFKNIRKSSGNTELPTNDIPGKKPDCRCPEKMRARIDGDQLQGSRTSLSVLNLC